ncbi:MAG TPA: hypothetical protein VJA16_22345 [Thermoanaerobaculia bacterium]
MGQHEARGVVHAARTAALVLAAAIPHLLGLPAAAQLLIASADGGTTLDLGTIAQIQGEAAGNPSGGGRATNLFFRRVRLEGALTSGDLAVFFETDSGTLGKGNPDGTKQTANGLVFLDFAVTYNVAKEFKLDGGLIRLAPTYTHNQAASSTLALDISPYAYVESAPLATNSGRDYGVQARGYLADHLEYRLGAFQGLRGTDETNPLRISGRLAWYVFGAEEGLYYRGTSLGKLRTLSFGTAFDTQKSYKNYNFDVYYDQPVHGGDGLTLELDHSWYDGHAFLATLPKQTTTLAEIGYYIQAIQLLPFFQYAQQKFAAGVAQPSERRYQFGAGYYFHGYNSNLKLAWTRIDRDRAGWLDDAVLQYQFYVF